MVIFSLPKNLQLQLADVETTLPDLRSEPLVGPKGDFRLDFFGDFDGWKFFGKIAWFYFCVENFLGWKKWPTPKTIRIFETPRNPMGFKPRGGSFWGEWTTSTAKLQDLDHRLLLGPQKFSQCLACEGCFFVGKDED